MAVVIAPSAASRVRTLVAVCTFASSSAKPVATSWAAAASSSTGTTRSSAPPATALLRAEHLGVDDRTGEVGRREPLATDLDPEVGHDDADRDLVGADAERPGRADAEVGRQHEEEPHGERMPRARDHDRLREGEHPHRELEPVAQHPAGVGPARGEHLQVETGGEHAGSTTEDDHGAVGLGAVEGGVDLREHVGRQLVDLAVVHRDGRDAAVQLVAHEVPHGAGSLEAVPGGGPMVDASGPKRSW